ncbi:MAG: hydrolase [Candidatus Levyibacteriota bacterium]
MKMNSDEGICCFPLDTSLWEEKTHEWKDKLFLQDEVRQIMHIPINMTTVVKRMFQKIEDADAMPEVKDFLMLAYDPSPWKSEIYMTVVKDIPNGKMAKLSGTYISKVYDGPYNQVPKWIEDMDKYLSAQNQKALKYYFHFAYCPKCVKKYGHNYCIAFAQVA